MRFGTKSDIRNWALIQSINDNTADVETRGVNPLRLGERTVWQNGPEWLKLSEEFWPVDYHYREKMPVDELSDVHKVNAISDNKEKKDSSNLIGICIFNSFNKLVNTTARVLKIVWQKTFNIEKITPEDIDLTETYWERTALKLTEKAFNNGL